MRNFDKTYSRYLWSNFGGDTVNLTINIKEKTDMVELMRSIKRLNNVVEIIEFTKIENYKSRFLPMSEYYKNNLEKDNKKKKKS